MFLNRAVHPVLRALTILIAVTSLHCGGVLKIGDPCLSRDECPGGKTSRAECALNLPNGYCTRACAIDADCDPGTQCQATGLGQVCVKKCMTSAECRIPDGIICIEAGMRSYCGLPQ